MQMYLTYYFCTQKIVWERKTDHVQCNTHKFPVEIQLQYLYSCIATYAIVSHTLTNHMQKDSHLDTSSVSWYKEVTCVPPLVTDVSTGDAA